MSQITVSTASTWQKNGRMSLKLVCLHTVGDGLSQVSLAIGYAGNAAPRIYALANFVDNGSGIGTAVLRSKAPFLHQIRTPAAWPCAFSALDRRDEFGAASALDDRLCRLSSLIEFPMPSRVVVGRIEDGWSKKGFRHFHYLSADNSVSRPHLSATCLRALREALK